MTKKIIVNLAFPMDAPLGTQSLLEIIKSRNGWPIEAKCATQERDGEVLYWNEDPEAVKIARVFAGADSLMPHIGFKHQVDSWFSDDDTPYLATDWLSSVVVASELQQPKS